MLQVDDLLGLWTRSELVMPDGRRDVTTLVYWLQGPGFYGDLRQPEARPDFSRTHCLRQLTSSDILWLSRQEAFAGQLVMENGVFHWQREIELQPATNLVDAGHLHFKDGILIENGRDIPYIEYWRRRDSAPAPVAAAKLVEIGGNRSGLIVRAGEMFMFVRSRSERLPPGENLSACVRGAENIAQAQDLVDCEVSLGRIAGDGWRILRSSLPFREGQIFISKLREDEIETSDVTPEGAPRELRWNVVQTRGALETLLSCIA